MSEVAVVVGLIALRLHALALARGIHRMARVAVAISALAELLHVIG